MEYGRARKRRAVAALIILEIAEDDERVIKKGKTRKWIRRRKEKGYFDNIVRELSIEDTAA